MNVVAKAALWGLYAYLSVCLSVSDKISFVLLQKLNQRLQDPY